MADPVITGGTADASTGGVNVGATVTLEQLAAIVAALAGSVQTLVQQSGQTAAQQSAAEASLQSLSENVSKLSDAMAANVKSLNDQVAKLSDNMATDVDSGYVVRSVTDPGETNSRIQNARDQTNAACMKMMWDAVENNNALSKTMISHMNRMWSQDSDHHDLGRHTIRVPAGPGTQDTKANT